MKLKALAYFGSIKPGMEITVPDRRGDYLKRKGFAEEIGQPKPVVQDSQSIPTSSYPEQVDESAPVVVGFEEKLRNVLHDSTVDALIEAGYNTLGKIQETSDDDLRKVKGVGLVTLRILRSEL